MAVPSVTNRKRLLTMLVSFTLIFIGLIGRLGYIQLIWGKELQQKAVGQWTRNLAVYPKRGMIKDRNGNILAQSGSSETIAARPSQIKDPKGTAAILAPILEMDEDKLYEKLSDTKSSFVWIKRQVTREVANQVRALGIKGIDFTEEPRRYYPNRELAAHVLGFTMKYAEGEDGLKGQDGVELYYDKYLKGLAGKIVMETDARGREMPDNVDRYIPPIDGLNLVLTIDQVIQHFTEKAVNDAMEKYAAKKVFAIVMDPNTGEILAMANRPTFDPNDPPRELGYEGMQEYVKNFLAKDSMDPGSTFKIITTAATLDSGVMTQEKTFNCPGFRIIEGNERIRCHKAGGHGHQTFAEAVENSCNPAFVDMALALGKDKFYRYIEAFGFGQKTGIDINGEAQGIVIPREAVKNLDLARIGFGQSISVTPLQLIAASAAAINGGNYMRPYLAKALTETKVDPETGEEYEHIVKEFQPQRLRQVISNETSKQVAKILQGVVENGSGANAYIPGYRVGGKTGTAQKYGEDGKIVQGRHIASFIGFAPADNPRVIVLFAVDEPQVAVDFGSVVAAPYVQMILKDTLPYLGVEPVYDEETAELNRQVEVPDVMGMTFGEAYAMLDERELKYLSNDSVEADTVIKDQMPKPGAMVKVNTTILLYAQEQSPEDSSIDQEVTEGKVVVPDLKGKSIREANNILVSLGLKLRIEGSGVAVSQDPPAHSQVEPGTEIMVEFTMPGQ
ncbi:MAG: penicillin-binding transpeptidase domain-containing protein [Caldicoprobacterales bacterium]|jgi:stage V sporulation protein D (sporulation-specific penicillin-binding protein)|nr:PASTA domain-containing protein [Clostridiales bacterium]